MTVTAIEYDVLDDVVKSMSSAPGDAYWARRLLDLVRDPVTANRLRPHLVEAIRVWVSHDPSFFVHERYLSEQLAVWAWPRQALEDLDTKLRLDDVSLAHLVMGRLWLEARRPPEDMPEFYARAARHLREVEPRLRVGAWHESMCEALGVADPDDLARQASAILDDAPPAARNRAVLAILRGAARTANWALYDAHRRTYGLFEPNARNSEIEQLDGLRAEQSLMQPKVPTFRRRVPRQTMPIDLEPTVRPPSRPG